MDKKLQAQAEHAVKREKEREKQFMAPEEPVPGEEPRIKRKKVDEEAPAKTEEDGKISSDNKRDKKEKKLKKRKHEWDLIACRFRTSLSWVYTFLRTICLGLSILFFYA